MDWLEQKLSWHEERRRGIGGSDMPIIMGVSPWKSADILAMEKAGKMTDSFKGNWATKRGTELEPVVRDWYNKEFNQDMKPMWMSSMENPVWRANFDGVFGAKAIEIKCPGKIDHETARSGKVPEKYLPQVHWLLVVSGFKEIDYVSYNGDYVVLAVKEDLDYQCKLMEAAIDFWKKVELIKNNKEWYD